MSSDSGILKPGDVIKPQISADDVPEIIKEIFGVTCKSIKQLNSYDDLNFLIETQDEDSKKYIFKVMNSLDSKDLPLVEGQNEMMLFLSSKGYKVPVPQKTLSGSYYHLFVVKTEQGDKSHAIRLLTFVPHQVLYNIPLTENLVFNCGSYIASIDEDLKSFSHSAVASRSFTWMMCNTSKVWNFVSAVKEPEKKKLAETALQNWDKFVEPLLKYLPAGFIHGDFNEQNILVLPTDETKNLADKSYCISGLIDFGDIQYGCYLFELSILVMAILTVKNDSTLCAQAIAGYDQRRKLTDMEWSLIWECVCARLCMSLTLGAYSYSQDPGNEYLLTTAKQGWEALASLLSEGKEKTLKLWRQVVEERGRHSGREGKAWWKREEGIVEERGRHSGREGKAWWKRGRHSGREGKAWWKRGRHSGREGKV